MRFYSTWKPCFAIEDIEDAWISGLLRDGHLAGSVAGGWESSFVSLKRH